MSYPYDLDIVFGSEQASVDSIGRLSFGTSGGGGGVTGFRTVTFSSYGSSSLIQAFYKIDLVGEGPHTIKSGDILYFNQKSNTVELGDYSGPYPSNLTSFTIGSGPSQLSLQLYDASTNSPVTEEIYGFSGGSPEFSVYNTESTLLYAKGSNFLARTESTTGLQFYYRVYQIEEPSSNNSLLNALTIYVNSSIPSLSIVVHQDNPLAGYLISPLVQDGSYIVCPTTTDIQLKEIHDKEEIPINGKVRLTLYDSSTDQPVEESETYYFSGGGFESQDLTFVFDDN